VTHLFASFALLLGLVVLCCPVASAEDPLTYSIPKEAVPRDLPNRDPAEYDKVLGYFIGDTKVGVRGYKDGKLVHEVPFKGGKQHGVERRWYSNGQLASESPYKDGEKHGVFKQWTQAGKLLGSYEMNMGTGIVKEWYPDGTIREERSCKNGAFDGPWKSFYPDSKPRQLAYYRNNRLHGPCLNWDERGRLKNAAPKYYLNDEEVTREKYLEAAAKDTTLPRSPAGDG
jgi:hypothetical protein